MKVALVQCPMFNVRMPQLGPAYLKSNLENNGHQVQQFDFNIALYNKIRQIYRRYWNYGSEVQWTENTIDAEWKDMQLLKRFPFLSEPLLDFWAKEIIKGNPGLVGFTIYYTSMNISVLLAKKIRKMDKQRKIIFGGPVIMSFLDISQDRIVNINTPVRKMLEIIDMVALSEGEETILEVIKRLDDKKTMKGCQGVIAQENGSLIVNKLRPLIRDLDSLPLPDFSILDSHTYTDKRFLPILATRGCPNRCTFCDFPYLDRYKFRIREAKKVVEEIKYQIKRHNTELFHFNDSTINANTKFLSELCDLIIEQGISIRWGASATIKADMERYLFDKMKRSGCEYLSIGIESASTKVLSDMKKFLSKDTIERFIADCHSSGILVCTNWIIGYFTERKGDFKETLNFIAENARYINEIDAALFSVKPHTYVYENHKKLGLYVDNVFNWHTVDNRNNYGIRLKRLEKFRQLQKNLGVNMNERIGGLRKQ